MLQVRRPANTVGSHRFERRPHQDSGASGRDDGPLTERQPLPTPTLIRQTTRRSTSGRDFGLHSRYANGYAAWGDDDIVTTRLGRVIVSPVGADRRVATSWPRFRTLDRRRVGPLKPSTKISWRKATTARSNLQSVLLGARALLSLSD